MGWLLMGLLPRLSLLCQLEVRLNGEESLQQGRVPTGYVKVVWLFGEN
jgi:hypothetical protein